MEATMQIRLASHSQTHRDLPPQLTVYTTLPCRQFQIFKRINLHKLYKLFISLF